MDVEATAEGIDNIEKDYDRYSNVARQRAEWIHERQEQELKDLANFIDNLKKPINKTIRRKAIEDAARKNKLKY